MKNVTDTFTLKNKIRIKMIKILFQILRTMLEDSNRSGWATLLVDFERKTLFFTRRDNEKNSFDRIGRNYFQSAASGDPYWRTFFISIWSMARSIWRATSSLFNSTIPRVGRTTCWWKQPPKRKLEAKKLFGKPAVGTQCNEAKLSKFHQKCH